MSNTQTNDPKSLPPDGMPGSSVVQDIKDKVPSSVGEKEKASPPSEAKAPGKEMVDVGNWLQGTGLPKLGVELPWWRGLLLTVVERHVEGLGGQVSDGRMKTTTLRSATADVVASAPTLRAELATPKLLNERVPSGLLKVSPAPDKPDVPGGLILSSRPGEVVLEARALMSRLQEMKSEDAARFLLVEFPYHVENMLRAQVLNDATALTVVVCDGLVTRYGAASRPLVFAVFAWLENAAKGIPGADEDAPRRLVVVGDTLVDLPPKSREDVFIFTWPYHRAIVAFAAQKTEDHALTRMARNSVHNMHAAISKSDLFDDDPAWPGIERQLEALDGVLSAKIKDTSVPAIWGNLASYHTLKTKARLSGDAEVCQHLHGAVAAIESRATGYIASELFNSGVAMLRREDRSGLVDVRAYVNCAGAMSVILAGLPEDEATRDRGFLDCLVNMFGAVSDMGVTAEVYESARYCSVAAINMCVARGRTVDAERLRGSCRDLFRGTPAGVTTDWAKFAEHLSNLAAWLGSVVRQKRSSIVLVDLSKDLAALKANLTAIGTGLYPLAWQEMEEAQKALQREAEESFSDLVARYYPLSHHPLVKGTGKNGAIEGILDISPEKEKDLLRPLHESEGTLTEILRKYLEAS